MKQLRELLIGSLFGISGCATPAPPPSLEFAGSLDFSRPGVRFLLTHPSGLTCEGQVASARLPDKFNVPLACSDKIGGTMDAVKTERIEGTVLLADSRAGKVTFDLPLARRGKTGR